MAGPLYDLLPPGEAGSDELLGRFLDYVAGKGLALYPAQEEAILELFEDKNVILNTPTGSGKSLVAAALHFESLAQGRRSVYTCPIKALVNEKCLALCREFGPENVGLITGDASVNRDAPILCCTAEILANIALREGAHAPVRRRDHGRVPLLRRPRARRGLAGAAADPAAGALPAHVRHARRHGVLRGGAHPAHRPRPRPRSRRRDRPVPLEFAYSETPLAQTLREAGRARARRRSTSSTSPRTDAAAERAGLHEHQLLHARGEERHRGRARRLPLHQPLRPGDPQVAQARHRPAPRRPAAEVPRAGRAARAAGPAQDHLRHGHARRRHQRARSAPCSSRGSASSTARRPRSSPRAISTRSPGAPGARASTTAAAWWRRRRSTSSRTCELGRKGRKRRQEGRQAQAAGEELRRTGTSRPSRA